MRRKQAPDGTLEAAVMKVLWDDGGSMTTAEVLDALAGNPPLAYNTVTTIMARLHKKGRLERERDGRAFTYRPVQSREDYTASLMASVLAQAQDRPGALARFVDVLDDPDRTQLRRLLKHMRTKE